MARTEQPAGYRRKTDSPHHIPHKPMRPTFDLRDAAILAERQASRDALAAAAVLPLVGDVVDLADGTTRRVTKVGPTSIQLTQPDFDASFYLASSGLCEFSGSLDYGHPVEAFTRHGRATAGVWFFHHGEVRPHGRVDCVVSVTLWKCAA